MKPADHIRDLFAKAKVETNPKADWSVLGQLVAARGKKRDSGSAQSTPGVWRRIMRSPIAKTAAVFTLVAAVIIVQSLCGASAWAGVVAAFNSAPTVHIKQTYKNLDGADSGASPLEVEGPEAWIKDQRLFRAETDDWCIVDNGKSVLTLYKDQGIAHIRDSFTPYWDYTPLVMKVFRENGGQAGIAITRLPNECTPEADVYDITVRDRWEGKAWVDVVTNLPMRINGVEVAYGGRKRWFEMTFDYEAIGDSLFSVAIPAGYRELPRVISEETYEARDAALSGIIVDQAGNPVPGALVCASYAQYNYAGADGKFGLLVSPEDGSGSMGTSDFPLFVWAYPEHDPYRVAWTLIRHPNAGKYSSTHLSAFTRPELRLESEATASGISQDTDGRTEQTHQGVRLVINDEDELSQYIPGSPGEVIDGDDIVVRDIVLAIGFGLADVITGRVTDGGTAIGQATVELEMLELQLGSNTLTLTELDEEWKVRAWSTAAVDNRGAYLLGNLPPCWSKARLVAKAPGYSGSRLIIEKTGNATRCDFQLEPGVSSGEPEDDDYYKSVGRPRLPRLRPEPDEDGGEHYQDVIADGKRTRGGTDVVGEVVPADLLGNLVLYYSFESLSGETTAIDISGNSRHGQIYGAGHVQDDVLGGGMELAGSDVYVAVPDIAVEQFTFSTWVTASTEGINNKLIYLLGDRSYYCTLQGNVDSGVSMTDSDNDEVNEYDWELMLGEWNHITVTCDGRTICVYRNGKLTEVGEAPPGPFSGELYIGGCPFDGQSSWRGYIDEAGFFNRALTPEEVARLFEMTGVEM